MEHSQTLNGNGRPRVYPELVKSSARNEREAAYYAALELVTRIDEELSRGIRHYRSRSGVLLTTLDEVINAILQDNLLTEEEHDYYWTPQELAA
ncbi:MAG TPA: hypothetical protein PKE64_14620 [Anaerolineae bacterium]|nr:hypothetical protein [Anaerolineae bacterium]HMR65237.1 hypothetical protein [Anaerolineae bacterium]